MTPRLNVSLKEENQTELNELRTLLEKRLELRLTLADVVRRAIHTAKQYEEATARIVSK